MFVDTDAYGSGRVGVCGYRWQWAGEWIPMALSGSVFVDTDGSGRVCVCGYRWQWAGESQDRRTAARIGNVLCFNKNDEKPTQTEL